MVQDTDWRRPGFVRVGLGAAALGFAAVLAGCQTDANLAANTSNAANGATLAFESIDGAPRPVFDKLVSRIDDEAKARKIAVVSREGQAHYRVRAYMAATVARQHTAINWVWDVYDSNGQRLTRISGAEPAGKATTDAWADADDKVLGRIAETGMSQLAAFASGGGATTVVAEPAAATPAVVAAAQPASAPVPDVQVVAAAETTAALGDAAH